MTRSAYVQVRCAVVALWSERHQRYAAKTGPETSNLTQNYGFAGSSFLVPRTVPLTPVGPPAKSVPFDHPCETITIMESGGTGSIRRRPDCGSRSGAEPRQYRVHSAFFRSVASISASFSKNWSRFSHPCAMQHATQSPIAPVCPLLQSSGSPSGLEERPEPRCCLPGGAGWTHGSRSPGAGPGKVRGWSM